jgi:mono/diheme cytochrome c family protein
VAVRSRFSRLLTLLIVLLVALPLGLWVARTVALRRGRNAIVQGQKAAVELGCGACHGLATGAELANPGSRFETVPRMNGGDSRLFAQSPAEITEWIRDGAPASLRADATAWEAYQRQEIRMPAFGAAISEGRIAQLTAYVLAANAWFVPTEEVALRGEEIVRAQCLACHNVGGAGGLPNPGALVPIVPGLWGPDFEDLVRSDEELREWILDGQSRRVASRWPVRWFWRRQLISMPSFRDRLSPEEIEAVTAYIRWLGRTRGGTLEEGSS